MKIGKANELNNKLCPNDRIKLDWLSKDTVLKEYIETSREALGIPKKGFMYKSVDKDAIISKLLGVSIKVAAVRSSYELSPRWESTLYGYFLFDQLILPEFPLKVTMTPQGVEIIISDKTRNISHLKRYLCDNGLENVSDRFLQSSNEREKRTTFKKYELRMYITMLKEKDLEVSEIVAMVRAKFESNDLPDPLRTDIMSDIPPTTYISKEINNLSEQLHKLQLKPVRSIKQNELRILAMLKRAYLLTTT